MKADRDVTGEGGRVTATRKERSRDRAGKGRAMNWIDASWLRACRDRSL